MPINTKAMIADTLHTLMQQKSFDKITVTELVEACNISRQTFYYHFQDILEVVEWSARQALKKALEQSLKSDRPEQSVRFFVDMAMESSTQIERLLHSQYREQFEKAFGDGLEAYMWEMIRHKAPDFIQNKMDSQIAVRFCACGIAGVLLRFSCEKDMDAERMTRQLCGFLEWLTR